MKRYFRVQHKGISFREMLDWNSQSGADDIAEGLAVCSSASGLEGGSRFGGAWDALNDDDEVVILEGIAIARIYDGWRIRPTREVARFTIREWRRMLEDGSAYEWE